MAVNYKWTKEDEEALSKADTVNKLISDLTLNGDKDSVEKADAFLQELEAKQEEENKGFNRSSINRNALKDEGAVHNSCVNGDLPNGDQAAFMAAIEEDARRRATRRAANRKKAEEWKSRGNEYFKAAEFAEAKRCYNEGMKLCRDWDVLYTNLAMACNKLGQYEETLEHCRWAERLDEKNTKALLHKGKALVGLRRPKEALEIYATVLRLEPKKQSFMREYIAEAEAVTAAIEEEENATLMFQESEGNAKEGDPEREVVRLICKLAQPGKAPPYYAGGLRVLSAAVAQSPDHSRTLFRLKSGFSLLERSDGFIGGCLSCPVQELSKEQRDVLAAVLEVCATVSEACEENQRRLMAVNGLPLRLVECLKLSQKSDRNGLRASALNFLFTVSQSESGRKAVNDWLDPAEVLPQLVVLVQVGDAAVANRAASLLNNMALSPRFQSSMLNSGNMHITEAVESLLLTGGGQSGSCLSSCLSCLTNLCGNATIRRRLSHRLPFLKACTAALGRNLPLHMDPKHVKVIESLLGVLINVTAVADKSGAALRAVAPDLVRTCSKVLATDHAPTHRLRLFTLLSSCLPACEAEVVQSWCEADGRPILAMARRIVCHETGEHPSASVAVRVMAAATQEHEASRFSFGDDEEVTQRLADFVQNSSNEVLAGNAALCMGHCVVDTCVAELLTHTDIIKALLRRCADCERTEARTNYGLLVAKLAQANPRHRERVSELHGFEIIHAATRSLRTV